VSQSVLHELVQALKDLALELGRSPTRSEFELKVRGANNRLKQIGGFSVLLQAAGLETYAERRSNRKITSQVFERALEPVLDRYVPRPRESAEAWPRIAVISDIHWPFHSQRVIDAFLAFIEKHQPDHVIINGDAWDMYCHSKYPRSLSHTYNPREEQDLARRHNEEFWRQVQARCPKAKCHQLLGNHDARPLKRVLEVWPEAEDWIEQMLRKMFTYDGVQTIFDPRQELMLPGDIMVHHGYRSKLGDHSSYSLYNCIIGHTHVGGAVFRTMRGTCRWELNSGVAGDPESKGLSYTSQKIVNWTPGFGWVDEYGPRFCPL
jgi:predicted phosphodiesterase